MNDTLKVLGKLAVVRSPRPVVFWPLISFWRRKEVNPWQREPEDMRGKVKGDEQSLAVVRGGYHAAEQDQEEASV